ncbi:MAG: FAD-dependent oxidoreductase [Planctomycetota bacterium]
MKVDVAVIGGGVGGVAAALAAADAGCRVVLTERYAWLGGQLTSQGVPPDDNSWIDTHGATARYQRWRRLVRQYYRDHYPLNAASRMTPSLNPGAGGVSGLCAEPRVYLAAMQQMLTPHIAAGRITLLQPYHPVSADADGDRVRSVTVQHVGSGDQVELEADYFLDATELGDVLPLAGVEYVTGSESKQQTGELHAADVADPENVQAITWCFALGFDPTPGADHTIDRPDNYSYWRDYVPPTTPAWGGRLLSWDQPSPWQIDKRVPGYLREADRGEEGVNSLFRYRRMISKTVYDPSIADAIEEVTLVNWVQNDYMAGNLIGASPEDAARYEREARELSRSLVYWLQTEAPNRATGGTGFPQLRLRGDLMSDDPLATDGLAQAPYIREARRIRARFTVTEAHVGTEMRTGHAPHWGDPKGFRVTDGMVAERFPDSVGIGHYRIDLHMSTGGDHYIDVSALPFQIPLGALLPERVRNLLSAGKNLGTTHITNGCYRLHPVEWNIGESAGSLAAFCLAHGCEPHAVLDSPGLLGDFQQSLEQAGVRLQWSTSHAV